jgi:AcrR family transcriptional regulator
MRLGSANRTSITTLQEREGTVSMEDPPAASLRDAQKQWTRKRLMDAAAGLFVTQGYGSTTVDEIATAAGATRATFYQYFRGKADLIMAAMQGVTTESRELYRDLVVAVASGRRVEVRAWLERAFRFWEEIRPYSIAYEDAAALDTTVRTARDNETREGVDAITDGLLAAGRMTRTSARVRAVLAFSQLEHVFNRWLHLGWDIDRDDALDVMTDMWMTAFRAGAKSRLEGSPPR